MCCEKKLFWMYGNINGAGQTGINQYSYWFCLFVWFYSLHPSQQSFSHIGTGLPRLNKYKARINVLCSRTQPSDAKSLKPPGLQSKSSTLPLSHCASTDTDLNLCVSMDSSFWFYTNTWDGPLYILRGSQFIISKISCIHFSENWFALANSADPDGMPQYAAFHLGLNWLSKYPFRGF